MHDAVLSKQVRLVYGANGEVEGLESSELWARCTWDYWGQVVSAARRGQYPGRDCTSVASGIERAA